jgi:Ser/Thr protein kinase RdoA (MazF antagonist)
MFEWIQGRFLRKSLTPSHLNELGRIIGRIHKGLKDAKAVHRRYWDAEGLVGRTATFGSVDHLSGISASDQKIVSRGRRIVFRQLCRFQDSFPQKQGGIHADLHFGNVLASPRGFAVIDFDDCGFGFHAYDLAVPLNSIANMLGRQRKRELPEYREALIDGYSTEARWDANDEAILPHLISARKLAMLGWLHSRSDNPGLRKHFKGALSQTVQHLKLSTF